METKIIFEVTRYGESGYDVWAHNESMSMNRTIKFGAEASIGKRMEELVEEYLN